MAPATLTIPQVESLLRISDMLREAFPDTPTAELTSTVSLFLVDHHTQPRIHANGNKGDQLIELLRREEGASIDDVVGTFGIKKNSAYARISVETRRRKLKVKHVDGRYHVAA